MESELELHEAIQQLHALATVPELYSVAVDQKCIPTLLGLLSHDNTDISVAVVNLLQELTDIDTLNESQDEAAVLIDTLLDQQVCSLLVHNLERLNEAQSEEADGVHNSLGNAILSENELDVNVFLQFRSAIVENLTEIRPEVCLQAAQQGLLTWVLKRLRAKTPFDANKLYCSEILSIFLQGTPENRQLLGEIDGIDILLQQLAVKLIETNSFIAALVTVNCFLRFSSGKILKQAKNKKWWKTCLIVFVPAWFTFQTATDFSKERVCNLWTLCCGIVDSHESLPFKLILKPDPFFVSLSLKGEENVQKWRIKSFESRT